MPSSAVPARFPPLVTAPLASAVLAFVSERRNQFKVFDSIVELVFVAMMDEVAGRDRSLELFPNKIVFHAEASLFGTPDTTITLGGELAVSTRSRAFWSASSHTLSISLDVSQHSRITVS